MFLQGIRARHAALGGGCEELMKELPPLSLVYWIHLNKETHKCEVPCLLFPEVPTLCASTAWDHFGHFVSVLAPSEGRSHGSRLNPKNSNDFLSDCPVISCGVCCFSSVFIILPLPVHGQSDTIKVHEKSREKNLFCLWKKCFVRNTNCNFNRLNSVSKVTL